MPTLSSEITVMFAGSVSVGAGCPMPIWNEAKEKLSLRSEAEHCTVVTPIGNVVPDAGKQVTGRAPSTASTALTLYVTGFVPMKDAGTVMTGPVVSPTKIRNEALVEPTLSVAVHVTSDEPSGKTEPDAGLQLIAGAGGGSAKLNPPTSSAKLTAAAAGLVASAVTTSGTFRTGGRLAKIVSVALPSVRTPVSSTKTTETAHRPGWPVTLSGISHVIDSEFTDVASTSATPPSV